MKPRHKLFNSLIALMVAVSFIPVTGQFAFAEGEEPQPDVTAPATDTADQETTAPQPTTAPAPAFSTSGQVKGLKLSSRTYKSVKISWTAYTEAA